MSSRQRADYLRVAASRSSKVSEALAGRTSILMRKSDRRRKLGAAELGDDQMHAVAIARCARRAR